jgi:hypothetical protein
MSTLTNQGGNDKDKDNDEGEVNIDELLGNLTKDLHKIYKNQFDFPGDLEAKNIVDILKVIYLS